MRNDAGMTLVEVLVAIAIVFIIFLGLSDSGLVVLDRNIKNSIRDEAVAVADNVMQQARNTPFDNLAAGPPTVPYVVFRPIRGLNQRFDATRTVVPIDSQNMEVTIDVAWVRKEYGQDKNYTHRIMTIVRQR